MRPRRVRTRFAAIANNHEANDVPSRKRAERAVGAQQHVLHRIVRLVRVAEPREAESPQPAAVAPHEQAERVGVPAEHALDDDDVVGILDAHPDTDYSTGATEPVHRGVGRATGTRSPRVSLVNARQQEEEDMRKLVIVMLMVVAAGAAFANGNAEKLTTIDGDVVAVEPAGELVRVMVETQDREQVMVELPAGEVERLRIRVQTRIRVEGVYIGVPADQPAGQVVRTRLLARTVNTGEGEVPVEEPVRLTLRDRQQIQAWERDQVQDGEGTQTQTRTQAQTGTQAQQAGQTVARPAPSKVRRSPPRAAAVFIRWHQPAPATILPA